ncbi:hypothetical protein ACFWIB_40300 [Streptomyces sp. NPDC127051]|uniref:hypothetical protein n=1 Tax=Streptomyces sp. NPDC127051 TaxID=3347119 RepID=UPI0036478A10
MAGTAVTFTESASTTHTGAAPRAWRTLRTLAIGLPEAIGADNITKTTRRSVATQDEHSSSWTSPQRSGIPTELNES